MVSLGAANDYNPKKADGFSVNNQRSWMYRRTVVTLRYLVCRMIARSPAPVASGLSRHPRAKTVRAVSAGVEFDRLDPLLLNEVHRLGRWALGL